MQNNFIFRQALFIIDALIVLVCFGLVSYSRTVLRDLVGLDVAGEPLLEELFIVMLVIVPLVPIVLHGLGFYGIFHNWVSNAKKLFAGLLICALVALLTMILTRTVVESRYFMMTYPIVVTVLISARSLAVHKYQKSKAGNEALKQAVQVFGSREEAQAFASNVSDARYSSWDLQEEVNLNTVEPDDLVKLLKERSVAIAVFLAGDIQFSKVSEAVEVCESMGVEVMIMTDFLRAKLSIPEVETVGGRTMITLRSTPTLSYSLLAKKVLDRFGALIIIVLSLPFWIVGAIGIKIQSPNGPIFFKQKRAGLYGRPFVMWKFRSMRVDAEAQLKRVKEESGNQMDGPVFKLDHDPRVFAWGSFIRKTSIDELPQLINVLRGEMSLVGPRPLPLYEVEEFQRSEDRRRLSVKPGLTCLWQVRGRNQITNFEQWVEMDLEYIDNWSFLLDLKILFMTIPAVLLSKGAK